MNKIASKVKLEVKKARVTRKCSSREEENGSILASQVVTPWCTQAFSLLQLSFAEFLGRKKI